jgi:hypothetical protein
LEDLEGIGAGSSNNFSNPRVIVLFASAVVCSFEEKEER